MTYPTFSEWPPIPSRSAPEADFDAMMYAIFQHFATTHRDEMLALIAYLQNNSTIIGGALNATSLGLTTPAAGKFTSVTGAAVTVDTTGEDSIFRLDDGGESVWSIRRDDSEANAFEINGYPSVSGDFVVKLSWVEAFRLDAVNGLAGFGGVAAPNAQVHAETDTHVTVYGKAGGSNNNSVAHFNNANAAFTNDVLRLSANRTNATAFEYLTCRSSYAGTVDTDLKIDGTGAIYSDPGSISAGADRAECMERHPDWFALVGGSDQRGVTVVLDGGYIRPAEAGEEPIGVISDTYDSLGNAAPLRWSEKFLKDDLGSVLWEDYEVVEWTEATSETKTETVQATEEVTRSREVIEVVDGVAVKRTVTETAVVPVFDEYPLRDEAGNDLGTYGEPRMIEVERTTEKEVTHSYAEDEVPEGMTVPEDATRTTQQRKMLNPDYDPSLPYVPRLERPEWDAVGVLGIVRVRAGQPVAPAWIKMRDISAEVEEWLVR